MERKRNSTLRIQQQSLLHIPLAIAEIENEVYSMKSCFCALQGAAVGGAQSQLCQTSDVHRGGRGEKMDCTRGWREVEGGRNYSKTNCTSGIRCFCSAAR